MDLAREASAHASKVMTARYELLQVDEWKTAGELAP